MKDSKWLIVSRLLIPIGMTVIVITALLYAAFEIDEIKYGLAIGIVFILLRMILIAKDIDVKTL